MDLSPTPAAAEIVRILRTRDGIPTEVRTESGEVLVVYNIAWGQDMSDAEFHITTNISPAVEVGSVDFFFTHQVVELRAPENAAVLFQRRAV